MSAKHSPKRAYQPLHPDKATDQDPDCHPTKSYGHSNNCTVE
jgi:hypothetical protein